MEKIKKYLVNYFKKSSWFKLLTDFLFYLFILLLINSSLAFSQAAINTDGSQPDPSAGFEVKFTNKGFLPPRIALTAANAASPVTSPAFKFQIN